MTKVLKRFLYTETGAGRDASHYVYDPRDLDENGNPPGWFLPQGDPIAAEPHEIEFDHVPTDIEIAIAFAKRKEQDNASQG